MKGINRQQSSRPPCGKRCFSEGKAKQVIRDARRSQSEKRKECRVYFCGPCASWHTTSQPYGQFS